MSKFIKEIILGVIFLIITYVMSGQLLEWDRFILFAFTGVIVAICAEGFGLAIGAAVSVRNGCILAPTVAAPLLALACYGMGFGPYIETTMKALMSLSFLRYGVTAFSIAIYQHRTTMECHETFCLYSDPQLILRDLGMERDTFTFQIMALLFFTVLHRFIAYLALRKPVLHSDESIQRIFVEHVNKELTSSNLEFPTTFWTQFTILSKRMFTQNIRNSTSLWIQLCHHLLSAFLFSGIFYNIGNNAAIPVVNFKFCLCNLVFFVYTHTMVPVLIFPFQVRLLRREYFNRWYSLKAYYAAMSLASFPSMIILGVIFLIITYVMSGQLLEWDRFILFAFTGVIVAICAEGFGLAIGAAVSVRNGCILAPTVAAPLLALACYGMGFGPYIETTMKALMSLSFLRYGVTAFSIAIYQHRTTMECHETFCLYSDPQLILRDLGMERDTFTFQIMALLFFTVLHKFIAYLALRYHMTIEFSNRFMNYVSKVLKH